VYVREGDPVRKGTILADMEDWEYRAAHAAAQAKYAIAVSEMNRALASNDGTAAGIQRLQADYWSAEVQRAQERLQKTHLRSSIDGLVATPHVENFAGKHLEAGDNFAEVVDASRATIDVAVEETEMPLLQGGDSAAVKLDGYPTRTFQGSVVLISPKSEAQGDGRVFYARVDVPNPEGLIRTGMQGRAKVSVGWHAVGYVLFRGPGRWIYDKLWSWIGW